MKAVCVRWLPRAAAVAAAAVAAVVISPPAMAATVWQSGQRAFGQVTVEPAVNDADGSQIFLLTPNGSPSGSPADPSTVAQRAHAPLYLPLYPAISTIPASSLNCTPANCDHARMGPYPLKGHDHLVGVASTHGDFNVAWDVHPVIFTAKGFGDGAINQRILTLTGLMTAAHNGDVFIVPTPVHTFNCSVVSEATYLKGTPITL